MSKTQSRLGVTVGNNKVYKALLTQTGVLAPVPTLLTPNTTGITFTYQYTTVGEYVVTLNVALDPAKTIITLGNNLRNQDPLVFFNTDLHFTNLQIIIKSGVLSVDAGSLISTLYDDLLLDNVFTVEILP